MQCDVAIIGGGVIGLACAWRLAQAGADVHLFERGETGREASWAAAGMLAAQCEAAHHPPSMGQSTPAAAMLDLCLRSRTLYPTFADELQATAGLDIELSLDGSSSTDWRRPGILYAAKADDAAIRQFETGPDSQEVTAEQAATLLGLSEELSPLNRYFWLPREGQIENRLLVEALSIAARRAGATLHENCEIQKLTIKKDRVTQLVSATQEINCQRVLLCAGAWSTRLEGLPQNCLPPVRPLGGQMLAIRPAQCPQSTLFSTDVYLVPRRDGRLLIGATVEENGFQIATTTEAAQSLLQAAVELLPSLRNDKIEAHWAGLRPGTPDGLPILGSTPLANFWLATGHYRNGILLAPITAQLIEDCLLREAKPPAAFHLSRFLRK